jgi:GPH family glycoside/pentoside/hexuronide:cation symporter
LSTPSPQRRRTEDAAASAEPTRGLLLAYALPALPLALMTLPFYVFVPGFYARDLALPLALVGEALVLVRIIDAISDPVIGILADRFRPRFGRRRLWVLVASPAVAAAAMGVFRPSADAGIGYLAIWGSLLSVGWTAMQIPYGAWGTELSRSYAGRTRVAAFREGATVTGTLLALAAPAVLPILGFAGDRAVLSAYAWAIAVGLPIAACIAVSLVPEPVERSHTRHGLREAARHMLGNKPFLRLILAFLINGLANGLPATLFVFFVTDRLAAQEAVGPLLLLYFVSAIIGVPVWLRLARRYGKHRIWAVGMMLAIAAFVFAPLLGPGDVAAFGVITGLTGLALGADVVLPVSLQADVIELDTARHGEERAGLYLSVWTLVTKLALAGAAGLAFPLLARTGFDPAANLRTAEGLSMLAWLYAGLPSLLKIGAVALVWRFPLDADAQVRIAADIAARARG